MSELEKKRSRIYDLLNETKPKFPCLPYTKQRLLFLGVFFLQKKSFLKKRKSGGLTYLT